MNKFNLNNAIEHYKLDPDDVAPVLFPNNKHPRFALNRILKGEAELTVNQLEQLASYIGLPTAELLNSCSAINDSWKGATESSVITLSRGSYVVKLFKDAVPVLCKDGKVITEIYISLVAPFGEVLKQLDNIINSYEHEPNQD